MSGVLSAQPWPWIEKKWCFSKAKRGGGGLSRVLSAQEVLSAAAGRGADRRVVRGGGGHRILQASGGGGGLRVGEGEGGDGYVHDPLY